MFWKKQQEQLEVRLLAPDDLFFTRGFVVGATVGPHGRPSPATGPTVPPEQDLTPPGPDWELVTDEVELARLEQELGAIVRQQPFWRRKAG